MANMVSSARRSVSSIRAISIVLFILILLSLSRRFAALRYGLTNA